jgi:hypothetical protein
LTVSPYYRNVEKENYYTPFSISANPSVYDTQIQELSVAGDLSLLYSTSSIGTQIVASYKERDEKHFLINPNKISQNFVREIESDEVTKNNHTSIFKISSLIFYNLNTMNRFDLSGSASILKYDTQSEVNFDDRDEVGFIIYAAHRLYNLKNLVLITSVYLYLYHTVYVFAEKSSNNNWNRVLRFASKSFFTPADWLRNIGTFSVLANYTVYDFETLYQLSRAILQAA